MRSTRSTEHVQVGISYWDIIRFDPTSFLTVHSNQASRLYHDFEPPSATADLVRLSRALVVGTVRLLAGCASKQPRRRGNGPRGGHMLLLSVGGAKYASEVRVISEECAKRGLLVTVVDINSLHAGSRDVEGSWGLSRLDHLRVLSRWLGEVVALMGSSFSSDAKRRALFASAVPGIRDYHLWKQGAYRFARSVGAPRGLISLAPSSVASRAIVDCMRSLGVPSAGLRTQTTSAELEFAGINTDLLFYKSDHERGSYEAVLGTHRPLLEEGCVLSLPERYGLEPLRLPERYALLLGTAPRFDQNEADCRRFMERLLRIGEATGLPLVLKEHDLGLPWEEGLFGPGSAVAFRTSDLRRNRELIDGATVIVCAPSTLLYYAFLKEKPAVIVEAFPARDLPDEFLGAPVRRIPWEAPLQTDGLEWQTLIGSGAVGKSWFEVSYAISKGACHVVDRTLNLPRGAR